MMAPPNPRIPLRFIRATLGVFEGMPWFRIGATVYPEARISSR